MLGSRTGAGVALPKVPAPAPAATPKVDRADRDLAKDPPGNDRPWYEHGWSEEQMCAWRKEILGPQPTQRGPIEFSMTPEVDNLVDEDSPIRCKFNDGSVYEVSHITMVPGLNQITVFHQNTFIGEIAYAMGTQFIMSNFCAQQVNLLPMP